MKIVEDVRSLREQVRAWRKQGAQIGFVPTMGNLHAGHLSLVEQARTQCERVIVSVFVNPTQFGPNEDFAQYPRTQKEDAAKLESVHADLLFLPTIDEMYPGGTEATTFIEVPGLSEQFCGAFRPGHFRGVATVVARLFNMVQPDLAVFGEKDYQQLLVIRRMVRELAFPIRVLGAPTAREPDGLAMSSRNQYLNPVERRKAALIYQLLTQTAERVARGEIDHPALEQSAVAALEAEGFRPDYFAIRRADDLGAPGQNDRELVILTAARLGRTRLIDNLAVTRA